MVSVDQKVIEDRFNSQIIYNFPEKTKVSKKEKYEPLEEFRQMLSWNPECEFDGKSFILEVSDLHLENRGARIENLRPGDVVTIKLNHSTSGGDTTFDVLDHNGQSLGLIKYYAEDLNKLMIQQVIKIDKITVFSVTPLSQQSENHKLFLNIKIEISYLNKYDFKTDKEAYIYEEVGNYVVLEEYLGCEENVTIPEKINGKLVIAIGEEAFIKTYIKNITLPKGLSYIGREAFSECRMLQTINIPDTVKLIGRNAFEFCTRLSKITIPPFLNAISENMLNNCSSLESIVLNNNVEFIGSGAFAHCQSLNNIALPHKIKQFGQGVFTGCKNLTKIVLPEGIQKISSEDFGGCDKLMEVYIPPSVTKIENNSFPGDNRRLEFHGYAGSESELYAIANHITFVSAGVAENTMKQTVNMTDSPFKQLNPIEYRMDSSNYKSVDIEIKPPKESYNKESYNTEKTAGGANEIDLAVAPVFDNPVVKIPTIPAKITVPTMPSVPYDLLEYGDSYLEDEEFEQLLEEKRNAEKAFTNILINLQEEEQNNIQLLWDAEQELRNKVNSLKDEQEEKNSHLSKLGILAIIEKKNIKTEIDQLGELISLTENEADSYKSKIEFRVKRLEDDKENLKKQAEYEISLIKNRIIKYIITKELSDSKKPITISELQATSPYLTKFNNWKLSVLTKQLEDEGKVTHIENADGVFLYTVKKVEGY